MPIVKPPYGLIAAINLDRGEVAWQTPHGDTPDNIRNHPALRGMNIGKTGQPGTSGVGILVTKTLVIMGDPQVTTTPTRPRGAMLRAYDKKTGQQVGEVWMPAPQSGSPMTYRVDGKQYIVVAVSGGNYSGEYPRVLAAGVVASQIPTLPPRSLDQRDRRGGSRFRNARGYFAGSWYKPIRFPAGSAILAVISPGSPPIGCITVPPCLTTASIAAATLSTMM